LKFDIISLGDHLTDPFSHRYVETQAERHRLWVDLGVHAEKAGYDAFWLGEHHCNDYILSAPQMLLGAVAVQTKRIRLGTSVSLLPNNDPVRLAEDFATLDLLSEGRAEIGFGSGITEHTFALFGQDVARSAEMSAENLELIQTLWNEGEINWTGKHRSPIHESQLQPRTFSGSAIPINRAVITSMDTAILAGRAGHRLLLLTAFGAGRRQRAIADAYRESYRDAGHDPAQMSVAVVGYTHVGEDSEDAWRRWLPYRGHYQKFVKALSEEKQGAKSLMDCLASYTSDSYEKNDVDVCGSPSEVADRILALSESVGGADRYMAYFDLGGFPRQDVFDAVDLFAAEVLPRVEKGLSAPA
jgi:alkanesulfonate monooxygenase SsuD/methylene tetrahydromethanopterin reductase-like flavin-dependent oxidoreductase (luciferase family)